MKEVAAAALPAGIISPFHPAQTGGFANAQFAPSAEPQRLLRK